MSSLFSTSIGKKFLMSVTGICLVLFLLFHMSMNLVAAFSGEAYNAVCEFLGANWYAVAATGVLAVGFIVHIIYAFILTLQNRKARGSNRYAVSEKPKGVEWASQNMLVLGIIVILGMGLHLAQFWFNMMFQELVGSQSQIAAPADGTAFIQYWFSQPVVAIVYIVWLVSLWFHITHGFWSALQTLGWNNLVWLGRVRCLSNAFATIVVAGFVVVVVGFAIGIFPLLG